MNETRKKNGEGSVFQVAENKWIAKISLGTRPDGKPNIKQFSGQTEAIVKKKLKDFKKSNDFAEKRMPSGETVRTYFSMWLREYQYNKLKPSSYDRLKSTVLNHIFPHIGGLKMDKVTRDQIQALFSCYDKTSCCRYILQQEVLFVTVYFLGCSLLFSWDLI